MPNRSPLSKEYQYENVTAEQVLWLSASQTHSLEVSMKASDTRTTYWRRRCGHLERTTIRSLASIGLQHQSTRLRKSDQSGLTIDMIFCSGRLRFSTWHVRLRDSRQILVDDAATEVGIAQGYGSRVAVVLGTGRITRKAKEYAALVNSNTPFYLVPAWTTIPSRLQAPPQNHSGRRAPSPLALLPKSGIM